MDPVKPVETRPLHPDLPQVQAGPGQGLRRVQARHRSLSHPGILDLNLLNLNLLNLNLNLAFLQNEGSQIKPQILTIQQDIEKLLL